MFCRAKGRTRLVKQLRGKLVIIISSEIGHEGCRVWRDVGRLMRWRDSRYELLVCKGLEELS